MVVIGSYFRKFEEWPIVLCKARARRLAGPVDKEKSDHDSTKPASGTSEREAVER